MSPSSQAHYKGWAAGHPVRITRGRRARRCPKIIQTQLLEVTREVAIKDFPHPWNNLLPEALPTIQSGNLVHMHGSLLMLRRVVSCLEFASQRNPTLQVCAYSLPATELPHPGPAAPTSRQQHVGTAPCVVRCAQEFSEATLPVLAHLLHTLLADTSGQPELAVLMRTILKIFWSCIYIEIPEVLSGNADLSRQWLKVCLSPQQAALGTRSTGASATEKSESCFMRTRSCALLSRWRCAACTLRTAGPKLAWLS